MIEDIPKAGTDFQSARGPSLVPSLLCFVDWANRDTKECDVARYFGKRSHTGHRSGKQNIMLASELQENLPY